MSQRTRKSITESVSTTPQRVTRRSLAKTEEVQTLSRSTRASSVTSETDAQSTKEKAKVESVTTPQKVTRKSTVTADIPDETVVRTPTRRTRTSSVSSVTSDVSEICSDSGRVTRRSSRLSGIKLDEITELPAVLSGRKRTSSVSSVTSETPQTQSKPRRRSTSAKDAESLDNATPIAKNRLLDLGRHEDLPANVSSGRRSRKLSLATVEEDNVESTETKPLLSTRQLEEIHFSSDNDEEAAEVSSKKKMRKSILPLRNELNTIDEDEAETGKADVMETKEDIKIKEVGNKDGNVGVMETEGDIKIKEGNKYAIASPRKSPRNFSEYSEAAVDATDLLVKNATNPKKDMLKKHIEDGLKGTPHKDRNIPQKAADRKKALENSLDSKVPLSVYLNKFDATDMTPVLVLDRINDEIASVNKRKSKGQDTPVVKKLEPTPPSESKRRTRNSNGHGEIPVISLNESERRTRNSCSNKANETPKNAQKKSLKIRTLSVGNEKSKEEPDTDELDEQTSDIASNEECVSPASCKRKSKESPEEQQQTPKKHSLGKTDANDSIVEHDGGNISIEEIVVEDDENMDQLEENREGIIVEDIPVEIRKRQSCDAKDVVHKGARDETAPVSKKRKCDIETVEKEMEIKEVEDSEGEDSDIEGSDDGESVDNNRILTEEEALAKLRLEKAKAVLEAKRKKALAKKKRKMSLKKKFAENGANQTVPPKETVHKGLEKGGNQPHANVDVTKQNSSDLSVEAKEARRLERILDKRRLKKEKWVKRLAEMKAAAAERKKAAKLEKKAENKVLFDAIRAAAGVTTPKKKNRRRKRGKKEELDGKESHVGGRRDVLPSINLSDIVAKLEVMKQAKPDGGGVLKERNEEVDDVARGKAKSGRWWKETKDKFSTMVKTPGLRRPHSEKEKLRAEIKHNKEMTRHILDVAARAKEEHRQRRADNIKRREENAKKAEIVQVIKNPAKLKRMKKKQLRLIEKRDTLPIIEKRNKSKIDAADV